MRNMPERFRGSAENTSWFGSIGIALLIGSAALFVCALATETASADTLVGWEDVRTAVDVAGQQAMGPGGATKVSSGKPLTDDRPGDAANTSDAARQASRGFGSSRFDAALPPLPLPAFGRTSAVQHHSLTGISPSVVPAITGDLFWSRPTLDIRTVGQSLGQGSSLRLYKPAVGVSVGSTTKPPFVGIK